MNDPPILRQRQEAPSQYRHLFTKLCFVIHQKTVTRCYSLNFMWEGTNIFKINIIWDVTTCSLLEVQCFRGFCCLYLQGIWMFNVHLFRPQAADTSRMSVQLCQTPHHHTSENIIFIVTAVEPHILLRTQFCNPPINTINSIGRYINATILFKTRGPIA